MSIRFQLEYWQDGDWFIGRLPQVPGVFSQRATLEELEENILDAYRMTIEEESEGPKGITVAIKESKSLYEAA